MNEIVQVTMQVETDFPVDARDVHQKLESKKQYSDWIKARIKSYGFREGADFLTDRCKIPSRKAGRPRTEYKCTYDMAKELCLVESTAKGREVRQYFIDIEKKARAKSLEYENLSAAEKFLIQAQGWVEQERKMKALTQKLEEVEAEARQDDDTLTHVQISSLDELINQKYRKHGNPKVVGLIRRAIKKRFFKIAGSRTYKEIPRSSFDEAMTLVANFNPPKDL